MSHDPNRPTAREHEPEFVLEHVAEELTDAAGRAPPLRVRVRWPKEVLLAARMLIATLAVAWGLAAIALIAWLARLASAFLESRS